MRAEKQAWRNVTGLRHRDHSLYLLQGVEWGQGGDRGTGAQEFFSFLSLCILASSPSFSSRKEEKGSGLRGGSRTHFPFTRAVWEKRLSCWALSSCVCDGLEEGSPALEESTETKEACCTGDSRLEKHQGKQY